ncbi:ABC transporter permease [Latilactobacillus curvatus]|uniref:Multidrug ABC transporter permease n=2 Tax=Latilactobacillus curvatus TaxID=28038 RepID=A0A385AF19_LATCU|nr:ABC transporter permease [Latilactobacillus curvatus]ASN62404.1 multidrug ABC transporter permease [Latilactobacillus curvatus]AXN36237.1 multidrug ABC transporter permease [Latilactobacillus curvatus]AZP96033.1 multidrug ABC transporter permease [Latilactobacillus curvatus]KRK92510.1 bacterial ABC transporter EcsB family protein [Latilactobacillus curvatus JCM 1096 = DSM 20019]MBZ1504833.1 ABC transporter permease [Latilactobacillus curvatus]
MQALWQKRVQKHIQEQVKYLRLVFNDHFVIAIIFLLGALGYTYANAVKGLDPQAWWLKPVLSLVLLAAVSFGRLATLLKEADSVFLLPKESGLVTYLKSARLYSSWLPLIAMAFVTLLVAPLLLITKTVPAWHIAVALITLVIIKDRRFSIQLRQWYQADETQATKGLSLILDLAIIASQLYQWLNLVGVLVALGLAYYQRQQLARVQKTQLFDWLAAVGAEDSRMGRIYRLYNLFTDVPGLSSQVKRRRYLDGLLKPITAKPANTYLYLYARGFLRGTEFSGLYIRLVVLGGIILCFSHIWWLSLALGLLLIYLVGFQLLPFYNQYDQIIFTHLYPVPTTKRIQAFSQLMRTLLLLQALLFSVILLVTLGMTIQVGLSVLALFVLVIGFVQFYLPKRLGA